MGTSLELTIVSSTTSGGPEAEQKILAEIDRLEQIFSVYLPESELNLWQRSYQDPVQVSNELATVLEAAERWRKASDGAFLPVVEALTRVWRDVELRQQEAEPTLAVHVNVQEPMWEVDLGKGIATRLTQHPASLNAIAKGYIVDRAVEVARQVDSVKKVLVNIGGDLRHWGEGAAIVAISDPTRDAENSKPLCHIRISNQAVATSGGYRRGFRVGGVLHSHVFDPHSEKPAVEVRSSSLIATTAMEADILATILGVRSPEAGLEFASRNHGCGAFVVDSMGKHHQNEIWIRAVCGDEALKQK